MNHSLSPIALFSGLLGLAVVMALFAWTSRINRFFFFARTLPASFAATAEARSITRRYIGFVLTGGGLGILTLTMLYAYSGLSIVSAILASFMVEIIAVHLAFAYAHHAAGAAYAIHSSASTAAAIQTNQLLHNDQRTIAVPLLASPATLNASILLAPLLLAFSLFFAGFAISSYTLSSYVDAIGEQGGAVLLGVACGMLFAGTAMRLLLRYSSRHRTPMAQYMGQVMAGLSWFAALVTGVIVLSVRFHHPITHKTAHVLMAGLFLLVAAHVVYLWSRNNQFTPSSAEQNGDQHWHAGLFYYNRQDPALFVQRRNGPGYTFNFANRYSWLLAALIIADPIFVLLNQHHL